MIKTRFKRSCDVVCLGLAKQEDEELDNLLLSVGLDINEDSSYKSILNDVVWCN